MNKMATNTAEKEHIVNSNLIERLAGTWHNQHNSEIEIHIDKEGRIGGFFRNGITEFANQSKEYPLVGFVTHDAVAFSVLFREHYCITSWTGHFASGDDEDTLQLLWHMSMGVRNQPQSRIWKSIISGHDRFVRGPKTAGKIDQKSIPSHPLSDSFCLNKYYPEAAD
jgi:hypothetical protein